MSWVADKMLLEMAKYRTSSTSTTEHFFAEFLAQTFPDWEDYGKQGERWHDSFQRLKDKYRSAEQNMNWYGKQDETEVVYTHKLMESYFKLKGFSEGKNTNGKIPTLCGTDN